jgi:hypothetical protein
MKSWSRAAQEKRRGELYAGYRALMASCIDERAGWHGKDREPGFREKVWHCFALLAGNEGEIALANSILRVVPLERCHFTPMSSLQLLLKHGERLAPDVTSRLRTYVGKSLPLAADPRIHFTMYNDNFASLACFTLVVGGELLGDRNALVAGRAKLEGLKELFSRRGTVMEYGSPTYTPVNTHVLSELATYARDPSVRKTARGCELRMWAEIATHWHAETSRLAGPYSRAYWVDTVGHTHLVHALLYLVFGEAIFSNPATDLFAPREKQVIHIGRETLMLPNFAWLWSGTCRCPDRFARLLLNKRYPFEVSCTSESLPSRIRGHRTCRDGSKAYFDGAPEYPGFWGPNAAYLTPDYALATGFSQYHDGALTETFHLTYRKRRPARGLADTGVAVARYIYNDKRPEQQNYYHVFDSIHGPEGFRDEGRKWGLQHHSCALYAYRPKPFEAHRVTSMKLAILLPAHFGQIEEVWIGAQRVAGEREQSVEPCPVFVKDGPVYMAFIPLSLTNLGRTAAVRVESWENYRAVCFYNYEGPEKAFDLPAITLTLSGFIVHVGSTREYADFAGFMSYASSGAVSDELEESESGTTRWISYSHPAVDLRFALSPASEGILLATINGRPRPEPIFKASGIRQRWLPFLS